MSDVTFKSDRTTNIVLDEYLKIEYERQIAELNKEISDLKDKLHDAKVESEKFEMTLQNFKFGNGITELEDKVKNFENLLRASVREYNLFLKSSNLEDLRYQDSDIGRRMQEIFEGVQDGSLSAQRAITTVKTEFAELITNANNGESVFDARQVQSFTLALEEMGPKIDSIVEKIGAMLSSSVTIGGGGGFGESLATDLERITEAAASVGSAPGEAYEQIMSLVRSLHSLATVDSNSLIALSNALGHLGVITTNSISAASVRNLESLIKAIQEANNNGTFRLRFDVSGWENLKIRKPTVDNIINLSKDVNAENLKALAGVDFSNLQGLNIDSEIVKRITELGSSLRQYNEYVTACGISANQTVPDISGKIEQSDKLAVSMQNEADAASRLNEEYGKHTLAVQGAIEAEKSKNEIAAQLAANLQLESSSMQTGAGAAENEAAAIGKLVAAAQSVDGSTISLLMNSLKEKGFSDSDIVKVVSEVKQMGGTIKDVTVSIDDLGGVSDQVAQITINRFDEMGNAYKSYLRYIKEENDDGDLVWTKTNDKSTTKVLIENEAAIKRQTEAARQYASMLNTIDGQMRSMTLIGGDKAIGTDTYNNLVGFKGKLEELNKKFNNPTEIQTFIAEMKKLGVEIETNRGKVSAYISTEKLHQQNTKKYTTVYKELEAELKKNSAAKHSNNAESAKAYRTIESTLTGLKTQKQLLDNGAISEEQFGREVDNASNSLKEQLGVLKANGSAFMSWSDQFKNISHTLASWVSPVRILMQVVRYIKQMISASIELNDAMTQMQIVTRASDSQMAKFGETAAAAAKRIGSSITDFVSSATTYARLGYDTQESSMFAEYTAMLQNVGDIAVDDAQNAITAIVKAFNVAPDELKQKMDEMVTIGNGFPISVAQIAEGMNNASSTLAAAGNDFEQSVALLTAANTTVQNAAKAATGLRTITARLRNTKADLEELGEDMTESKYEELVQTLTGVGVALTDVNNNYRSTYDIMKDIADAWDKMNGEKKSALVTALAGTRQQDIFYSIINQFRDAEKAYSEMVNNSTGALDRAYSTYMESASAHINQFKATFQELSSNFIKSDFIADIADIGTGFLKATNWAAKLANKLGGVRTIIVAIVGLVATLKADIIKGFVVKNTPKLIASLKSIALFIPKIIKAMALTGKTMVFQKLFSKEQTGLLKNFSDALKEVGITASTTQIAFAGVAAAITGIVIAINAIKQAREKSRQTLEDSYSSNIESAEESAQLYDLYEAYYKNKKALEEGIGSKEDYTEATKALTDALIKEGDAAKKTADDIKGLTLEELEGAKKKAEQSVTDAGALLVGLIASSGFGSFGDRGSTSLKVHEAMGSLDISDDMGVWNASYYLGMSDVERVEYILEAYKKLEEERDKIWEQMQESGELSNADYESYNRAIGYLQPYITKLTDARKTLSDVTSRYNDILHDNIAAETAVGNITAAVTYGNIDELRTEIDKYQKILGEVNEVDANLDKGALNDTIPTLTKLAEKYGVTVDEIIEQFDRLQTENTVSVYGSVEALDKGFKKLGELYSDIQDGGTFDYSKLFDDKDFKEEFGEVGDAYNEFIKTVAESPTDIAKCQDAFNELAKQYIVAKGALDDVTEAQRDATIALLEQKGVANATEIVDAVVIANKKSLAQRMSELAATSDNTTKALFDQITALYESGAAASALQEAIYNLLIEKIRLNETGVELSDDINAILQFAGACGASTEQVAMLASAIQLLNKAKNTKAIGAFPVGIESEIANAKNTIKSILSSNKLSLADYMPDVSLGGYKGPTSGKSGSGNSGNKTKEDEEDPFLALYKEHKHAVEMEQETLEQFYAWLDGSDGYKKYYKEGTENFWKYEEEVKKGYRDLFKDMMSDMEHEISMREMFDGEFKTIDDMYVEMIKMVEDRIAQARHDGLSDESDYIQELQNLLQKYANDRAKLREDAQKAAVDSVDALVEIRVKMLKQDIKNERDALKKRLDELKKFYDKQKEMLRDANDEEKYLEEQAEKRKKVFDLESQLRQLDLDDSAWAQKKKLELEQELADARKELDDFERDHALEMAEDQLDKQYEAREAAINKYDELLEEQEDDEISLYAKALADVRSGSVDLYNEMLEWNKKYGDGINDTITNAWNTAYKALNDYKDLFGSFFKDVKLANVAMQDSGFSWDTMQASDAGAKGGDSFVDYSMEKGNGGFIPGDIDGDGKVSTADARRAVRAAIGLEKLSEKEIRRGDIDGDGKISTGDARKIMRLAIGLDKQGYASGTSNATPGIHRIDEHGDETIFSSRDGNKYKLFSGGEKVLNAKASNFLYSFANSGGEMIKRAIGNAVAPGLNGLLGNGSAGVDIRTGDIIINGSADKATVSEIRRAQRGQVETILKSFNRLKA